MCFFLVQSVVARHLGLTKLFRVTPIRDDGSTCMGIGEREGKGNDYAGSNEHTHFKLSIQSIV